VEETIRTLEGDSGRDPMNPEHALFRFIIEAEILKINPKSQQATTKSILIVI
jgi:hypothetical protein